jgi:xanthine/uracil/vitamin C permease (AzgA family)
MMMNESSHIDWQSTRIAIPSFLCAVMMPFTYSIPNGILFGIAGSVVFFITTGEFLERFGCVKAPVPGYAQDSDALLGSVKVQYSAATGTLPV